MDNISQIEPWIGAEERQAVVAYMDAGGWLTEFRKTREFEAAIAGYVGSRFAAAVSNGTVSLTVALLALGIGQGDEVIVPDYTMIASANAVIAAGATPVLVDIDPTTLCLDLEKTEKAITPRTRAIMLVTINGRSPDMETVVDLTKKYNLYLVEDAAQSLGSTWQGKHLGTFGQVGSFSFSFPKIITTGQGGALVTDDEALYRKIQMAKDFGRPRGGVDYHETFGLNAKFTDLQAVIGIEQMKKLPWRVKRKKELYRLYARGLQGIGGLRHVATNAEETAPWFFDVMVTGGQRDQLSAYLKERGIGTRPFYPAIHTQPPYSHVSGDFPGAVLVSQEGLWLPSSSFLTDDDIGRVCEDIRSFYRTS